MSLVSSTSDLFKLFNVFINLGLSLSRKVLYSPYYLVSFGINQIYVSLKLYLKYYSQSDSNLHVHVSIKGCSPSQCLDLLFFIGPSYFLFLCLYILSKSADKVLTIRDFYTPNSPIQCSIANHLVIRELNLC